VSELGQKRPNEPIDRESALSRRIQLIDATPFPSNLARWNDVHMEGHARTWFTPKQKAELWEHWKSGQWVADVARALEERKRCLRSWLSMEEFATLQHPGWAGNHIGFYPFPMSIADENA
jgi:hypothetical protein